CVFNLTDQAHHITLPVPVTADLDGHGFNYQRDGDQLTLPAYQAAFMRIAQTTPL
ncbi:MAG: alpha-glucosidase MalZ, partial [Halomonas sp. HL-93]